jgi:hypothetical protein
VQKKICRRVRSFFCCSHLGAGLIRYYIQFGSDYFEYVSDLRVSWSTAETNAASLSYMGATGYLAVVTSAAENNFLAANFTIRRLPPLAHGSVDSATLLRPVFGWWDHWLVSSSLRGRHLSAGPMSIGVGSNPITPRAMYTSTSARFSQALETANGPIRHHLVIRSTDTSWSSVQPRLLHCPPLFRSSPPASPV